MLTLMAPTTYEFKQTTYILFELPNCLLHAQTSVNEIHSDINYIACILINLVFVICIWLNV